jgi:hypothetical protein
MGRRPVTAVIGHAVEIEQLTKLHEPAGLARHKEGDTQPDKQQH